MNGFFERLALWLPHLVQGAFLFAAGACVGSFVNLTAWRLPLGQGIIHPASRCCACGRALPWFENIPILSFILLRGRCRTCGERFGAQHLLVESGVGALFLATYLILFAGPWQARAPESAWWWIRSGPLEALPALAAVLVCWGALTAVSLIDARTFHVPVRITLFATVAAFLLWRVQALVPGMSQSLARGRWGLPILPLPVSVAAVGGMAGLLISGVLLWRRVIPRSFADPHMMEPSPRIVRAEMLKESVFLAPIAAGIAAGHQLGTVESIQAWCGSPTFAVLGICSAGFLAGGGIVWMTRITASLAFGREAMGLGDVHILAAAGAALGWKAVVIAFFVAPFLALAWLAVFGGLHRLLGTRWREIPYGPYLALACVVSFLGEPWLDPLLRALFVPPA